MGDPEVSCDQTVTGQVFERAVFEWHPEINGGTILLRLLGTDYWGTVQDQESIQGVNVPDYNGGTTTYTQPAAPALYAACNAHPHAAATADLHGLGLRLGLPRARPHQGGR